MISQLHLHTLTRQDSPHTDCSARQKRFWERQEGEAAIEHRTRVCREASPINSATQKPNKFAYATYL